MKIALCVSGLMRDAIQSFTSMRDNLSIEGVEVDTFIHTWITEPGLKDDKWGMNAPTQVSIESQGVSSGHFDVDKISGGMNSLLFTELAAKADFNILTGLMKSISEIIPITMFQTERVSDVQTTHLDKIKESFGKGYKESWSPHNYSCWLYSLYQCNKLKNEYADRMGIKYDLTIRSRTELTFVEPISISTYREIKEKDYLAIPKGADWGRPPGINDLFAIGSNRAIDWYCSIKNHCVEGANPHKNMDLHIQEGLTLLPVSTPKKYKKIWRVKMPILLRNKDICYREGVKKYTKKKKK